MYFSLLAEMVVFSVIWNNEAVYKGYENRNYADKKSQLHSTCKNTFEEQVNIKTNKCEVPPLRNLGKTFFYLETYLILFITAANTLLNENLYTIYGVKSSNFRFKLQGEPLEAPSISDEEAKGESINNSNPNSILETAKSFVTNPVNIAKFRAIVRNTGLVVGAGVLGLGAVSLNEYRDYGQHGKNS